MIGGASDGRARELPTTEDLDNLWFELQREITEQGRVARYTTKIRGVGGVFHIRSPEDEEPGLLYQMKVDYLR